MKEVWWHAENMLYPGIGDEYSLQTRTGLTGTGYKILESFADPFYFPKKLLDSARFLKTTK